MNYLKTIGNRLASFLFICLFGCTLLIIIRRLFMSFFQKNQYFLFDDIYSKPLNPLIVLIGAVLFIVLILYLASKFYKLHERIHKKLIFVFIPIILVLQVLFVLVFHVDPKNWDFEVVYGAAKAFGEGYNPFWHYFYDDYPNNIAITLMLGGIYRLLFAIGFHHPQLTGLIFNIFMIDLSIVYLYLTAKKMFGIKNASIVLAFSLLFSPFITYTPIYYTDTLSLPFGICAVYYYILSRESTGYKRTLLCVLTALLGAAGFLIKSTVAIIMIAILIHMLLTEKFKGFVKEAAILLTVLFLGINMYSFGLDQSKLIPIPYKQAGYPFTHWVMMGLKEPYGFYDDLDVDYTESFATKEQRREANLIVIEERLHNYGIRGLIKFISAKDFFIWGDGTYFAPVKLSRGVPVYTKYHQYILQQNKDNNYIYIYYCQVLQVSLIILMLASAIYSLKRKIVSLSMICRVAIFGLSVFILMWEARSRYLINFAPLILLCSADGLLSIQMTLKNVLKRSGTSQLADRVINSDKKNVVQ